MLNVLFMNAQINNQECVVIENGTDPAGIYSYSTDIATLNNYGPLVFNVKFWGVNRPNGDTDFYNREHDALQAIANLNIMYNPFNIFFKFRGLEEFNSPEVTVPLPNGDPDTNGYYVLETRPQFRAMVNWAAANGYKDLNALNVYAVGWLGFAGGIAYRPGFVCATNSGSGLAGNNTVHEISHNLNLKHTRSFNEHTTRDPNNQYFNATTTGDEIVDTNANSGFWDSSCDCTPYVDQNTCTYFGTETDELGFQYTIAHKDVINIMGDAYGGCATKSLTVGQAIRVHEKIASGYYNVALTNVASLYEPYAGAYYDPNNQNPQLYKPLFQPGFEYRFLECSCDCPDPVPYEDISFSYTQNIIKEVSKYESDFSTIYHPNHSAIGIKIENNPVFWPQPRRCYDNPNYRPIGGSITRFNDNVFNTNITLIPKDSTGINNPNLIEQLQPGLYKIEKTYEEGNTEQDIIFKQD
ncbi:MAG: hypothetical protein CL525_07980 [Aequorivita sp.]|jgi:hypothetical protein|nr:hypothetical protein [Aequorivita sp.]|tara:strand:+ start:1881 stop:3281 length:1401 start_codon:yes stop_codon:yes gene_type:complete